MFKKALKLLAAGRDLDEDIMSACMHAIMSGEATDVQISSFLTALLMKGETAQEIAAAATGFAIKSHSHSSQKDQFFRPCGYRRYRR